MHHIYVLIVNIFSGLGLPKLLQNRKDASHVMTSTKKLAPAPFRLSCLLFFLDALISIHVSVIICQCVQFPP